MKYWYFKSEPNCWNWDEQLARGAKGEPWDGVRNYQARNNMRDMKKGDLGLFYHSVGPKEFVGVVKVIREARPDTTTDDPRWEMVDVAAVQSFARPISLDEVKNHPDLAGMQFVKQGRLSVGPVEKKEFETILKLAGTKIK